MILTAHQPSYLPWLGLFAKVSLADAFCIFDMVQYSKKGFDNRNRIMTDQGVKWLTVPVESSNHRERLCKDIRIVPNQQWARKHCRSLRLAYSRAPYLDLYMEELESVLLGRKYEYLADLNRAILDWGLAKLQLAPKIVRAQDHAFVGRKGDLVLDMCTKLGATKYIFGGEGLQYANPAAFLAAGVSPIFLDFEQPNYDQGDIDFCPNLSFVDLLFHAGPASSEIVRTSAQRSLLRASSATRVKGAS